MPSSYCPQIGQKATGETRLFSVDFGDTAAPQTGKLDTGKLLTGTPTISQDSVDPSSGTSLTLASKVVNTGTITINGRSCVAGTVVQFTAAAGTDGATYTVKITCSDDGSPAQTLVAWVTIYVTNS